jgi:hypothetical protein
MTKQLTQELRDYYWKLAEEKVENDNKKIQEFIKENNLTSTSEQFDNRSENYVFTIYDLAKKMWEADGYVDPPANYVNNKEREKDFCKNIIDIINDKFVKESQEEMDKSFIEIVDNIVKG